MSIPSHIAIIMDGNGRWAEKRGLERIEGHRIGAEVADAVSQWCADSGIKYVTLYAFSTENWKRPRHEVNYLFELMLMYITSQLERMLKEEVRMRFMGRLNELPEKLLDFTRYIEEKTRNCSKLNVIVALNYGGRAELLDAVTSLIRKGRSEITESDISSCLYIPDLPEPDLIIRTSGERRLSNFLLWQCSYSEFFFTDTLWPDFSKKEFLSILEDYSKRKRRFGAVDI